MKGAGLLECYEGWMPVRTSVSADGELRVDWAHLDGLRFTGPFFHQTVGSAMRSPFTRVFRHETSVAVLSELARRRDTLPLAGFVAHVSRCGSTLLSQVLSASRRNIVLAEPDPLDTLLRSPELATPERVRELVAVLGARRFPFEERVFLKLDAWSARRLSTLRAAFPGVPWIVLYRDPLEVLVSHLEHSAAQMLPGVLPPETFGLTVADLPGMTPEDYTARVLASIAEALVESLDEQALVLSHEDLLGDGVARALRHLGVDPEGSEVDAMRDAAKRDPKGAGQPFVDDRERKRRIASDAARSAVARWAEPAFARLAEARDRQRVVAA